MTKFLALYLGAPGAEPAARPNEETIAKGMAAWGNWMAQHASQVVDSGGPLGKTKKASKAGVSDTRNNVAGYIVIESESHYAAATLSHGPPPFPPSSATPLTSLNRL